MGERPKTVKNSVAWKRTNDIDQINALRTENTSESDLRSYEATKAVARKPRKNYEASTGLCDLRHTGTVLYQLSYENTERRK